TTLERQMQREEAPATSIQGGEARGDARPDLRRLVRRPSAPAARPRRPSQRAAARARTREARPARRSSLPSSCPVPHRTREAKEASRSPSQRLRGRSWRTRLIAARSKEWCTPASRPVRTRFLRVLETCSRRSPTRDQHRLAEVKA